MLTLSDFLSDHVIVVYLYRFAIPRKRAIEELMGLSREYLLAARDLQLKEIEEAASSEDPTKKVYREKLLKGLELIEEVLRSRGAE